MSDKIGSSPNKNSDGFSTASSPATDSLRRAASAQLVNRIEKDIRKLQKQMRRLEPKLAKAVRNYNRVLADIERGNLVIKKMVEKRDEVLIKFQEAKE